MSVEIKPAYAHTDVITALFTEYTKQLDLMDARLRQYLDLQNYDHEINHLTEKYGPPAGRLYLAYDNGQPAGCIALRPMNERDCEMKRLFVRPQFRRRGIARELIVLLLNDAAAIGYREMYLDTVPALHDAIVLYEKMGFRRTAPYNDSPVTTTVFMKKTLVFKGTE